METMKTDYQQERSRSLLTRIRQNRARINEDELENEIENEADHECLNCGMKNYPTNHNCSDTE